MNNIDKKLLYILITFCCLLNTLGLHGNGLRFFGNNYPINKRTSYDVFSKHSVSFSDNCIIEFDLSLYQTSEIGNILRIKSDNNSHIFSLFYDGHGEDHLFLLNEEGKSNLKSISLNKQNYPSRQWLSILLDFNIKQKTITFSIEGQTYKINNISLPDKFSPTIIFGRSDHIIDVPPFAIRNLIIGNSKKYKFLLNEHQGDIVHDIRGIEIGSVTNPDWLINESYHWKSEIQFSTLTSSGSNYHSDRKEFYYFNRDSILIYNLRTETSKTISFKNPCPVDIRLGTNFIDQENDRLYCYEVYHDRTYQGPTVASLDLHSFEWRIESYDQLPTQLHHHASYFDATLKQYIIFGGFGNMRFSNEFYKYDLISKKWDIFPVNNKGNITPRYFTSLGIDKQKGQQLYLFGGTGNYSGDQLLGREYFYDLFRLDLHTKEIVKVWEIPWDTENVVPIREMLINNEPFFYTLCYPEHFTESHLKLYRFSIEDGEYTILGDSIPIYSDKINTNANLYYDHDLSTLYAVVHQFEDDVKSNIHIYSIAFPPITEKVLSNQPPTAKKIKTNYILFGFIIFIGVIIFFVYHRRKRGKTPILDFDTTWNRFYTDKIKFQETTLTRANSIFLFGEFSIYNKENRDVTYMFSKKLKETFCILLQYSREKGGITSQQLSKLLWPEKDHQDVKNIRNVTINRLRKILEELDGIELLFEKGMFILAQKAPCYCDYTRCMEIILSNPKETEYNELIKIVTRGKFLENEDNSFYDSLKEQTEKLLEPFIIISLEKAYENEDWQMTINMAKAAFHIDPMNEIALNCMIRSMQKLGMHEEAKLKYFSFLLEYKKINGRDFPNPIKL